MPDTTGSIWSTFSAATKAKASEVNNNFDWSEKNLWPHSTGVKANKIYNLGDTDAVWNIAYINSLNDGSTGVLIGTTTATQGTSTSLEIAGVKAVLMPRLTTTERDALTPQNGMIIYNETTELWNLRENGAWRTVANTLGLELTGASLAVTLTAQTIMSVTSAGVLRTIKIKGSLGGAGPSLLVVLDGLTLSSAFLGAGTSAAQFIYADLAATLTSDGNANFLIASEFDTNAALGIPFKTSLSISLKAQNTQAGNSVTADVAVELP